MKIQFTMKTPDVAVDTVNEAVREEFSNDNDGLSDEDFFFNDGKADDRRYEISELCQKWFEGGEYVTLELDVENKTMTVVPRDTD